MAKRPIFIPKSEGPFLVETRSIDFLWFSGLSVSQKKKSVASLHKAAQECFDIQEVLEVSSKSEDILGIDLSAFNLMITTQKGKVFSVECAFQSSKVFEDGGPFVDLLDKTSREAKKDSRLKESGQLKRFEFYSQCWQLEPLTAFYDWLYINALRKKPEYQAVLEKYSAFSDIEFNPEKSINCQAYSIALFMALKSRNLLEQATSSQESFLKIYNDFLINNTTISEKHQLSIKI